MATERFVVATASIFMAATVFDPLAARPDCPPRRLREFGFEFAERRDATGEPEAGELLRRAEDRAVEDLGAKSADLRPAADPIGEGGGEVAVERLEVGAGRETGVALGEEAGPLRVLLDPAQVVADERLDPRLGGR